ncbi:MAG TPA: aldo/keto reductase [Ramlibacter sp.]|uniref:aldo/keto reductase n=1 Tax=Ramlibacter sp. TaxID=1917967 RepID=UPI002CFD49F0|nr:aldo/keto reductase [Ramlibacter sp.]HVZ45922.1 aldo/keto reductase [Ramlibacter sp.]
MRQRPLGATGLAVSEIGFGCGPTAGLMIEASAAERREAVGAALERGITYFDTAPVYGGGMSEAHLGQALAELDANPVVATKVALEAQDFGDIAQATVRSVEASVQRLGRPVTLIHLHNRIGAARAARAAFGSGAMLTVDDVLGPAGVMEAFDFLRARGLVRYFGCSAYGGDMHCVRTVVEAHRFHALVVSFSALNPTAWKACAAGAALRDYAGIGDRAAACGMGTIALRVLEAGLLGAAMPPPEAGSEQERMWRLAPAVRERFAAEGIAPAQGAIRYVLSQPGISCALVGFSSLAQIAQAADAAAAGPLAAGLLDRLEALRTSGPAFASH